MSNNQNFCPVCSTPSTSFCSHCKKVVYCCKEHQKEHRKEHKPLCFPADLKHDPVLGHHLQATRDISPGERIFKEQPLIFGPRSNLSKFYQICLGCCSQIDDGIESYKCSKCRWPMCNAKCEKAFIHSGFECPILSFNKVPPAKTEDEYLCITFLRCLLLQKVDPSRWSELLQFEAHTNLRKSQQSEFAIHYIKEKCGMKAFEEKLIDFVYGIIMVNGYGDEATFAVKLYSKSAKLSHACIPNTRTLVDSAGLEIIAATGIKQGSPLTQLYGRMFKGSHRRQELLQNVYYFSCSCERCKDPTELGTNFSSVKCRVKKCPLGYLHPIDPLDISPTSKWKCDNPKCHNSLSFVHCVLPVLKEIEEMTGMGESEALFAVYEIYGDEELNDQEILDMKTENVVKMLGVLAYLEKEVVHKNHYALLPLKTCLIATIYTILEKNDNGGSKKEMRGKLVKSYGKMVKEVLAVVNVLLPGMTSERGMLLFHLSEFLRFQTPSNPDISKLQDESRKIMMLDSEQDDNRKLVLSRIGK